MNFIKIQHMIFASRTIHSIEWKNNTIVVHIEKGGFEVFEYENLDAAGKAYKDIYEQLNKLS